MRPASMAMHLYLSSIARVARQGVRGKAGESSHYKTAAHRQVLQAEYRGTLVAVKRALPAALPAVSTVANPSQRGSRSGSISSSERWTMDSRTSRSFAASLSAFSAVFSSTYSGGSSSAGARSFSRECARCEAPLSPVPEEGRARHEVGGWLGHGISDSDWIGAREQPAAVESSHRVEGGRTSPPLLRPGAFKGGEGRKPIRVRRRCARKI